LAKHVPDQREGSAGGNERHARAGKKAFCVVVVLGICHKGGSFDKRLFERSAAWFAAVVPERPKLG
jgi:hypothetical protein